MILEMDVKCAQCNSDLRASCGHDMIEVEPCRDCLAEAKSEADADGYERGLKEAEREIK